MGTNYITKAELITKTYKKYIKDAKDINIITIDLDVFRIYYANARNSDCIDEKIYHLNNELLYRFERNHYTLYKENETYKEHNILKTVKKRHSSCYQRKFYNSLTK